MPSRHPEPVAEASWSQVLAWRLARQHLAERAPREAMLDVVGAICCLHAQLMSSAELSLWARVEGLEPDAVQAALWERRTLVKTWAMRGTLHLVPAAELPLWQAATSTNKPYLKAYWQRAFEVTSDQVEELIGAVADALDGKLLTREELAAEVARRTGSKKLAEKVRGSWGTILKLAAWRGRLCFAPNAGRNVRFTRPDTWLEGWREVDPADAQPEVTRRYLAAYGPATREDYANWWMRNSPTEAAGLIRDLGDDVAVVDVEGTPAWMLRAHLPELEAATATRVVRLLPAFDPYVIGAPRKLPQPLSPAFKDRVYRPQGWVSPVLAVDGRIEGVWRHERKGAKLLVDVEPFGRVPAWARRVAEAEAERLAGFLDGELEVRWNP